jgi:hypothetical protein
MKGISIFLESGMGDTTSYAVYCVGDATNQPDQMEFEDIYITSPYTPTTAFWYQGVTVDGNSRTSPQGVRVHQWRNIQIFCCRNLAAYFRNAVQFSVDNIGAYSGKSGTSGNDIQITGGGSASTNSAQFSLTRFKVGGELLTTECSDLHLVGITTDLEYATTATFVHGYINVTGSVTGSLGSGGDLVLA